MSNELQNSEDIDDNTRRVVRDNYCRYFLFCFFQYTARWHGQIVSQQEDFMMNTMHILKHNCDTGRACRQPQQFRLIISFNLKIEDIIVVCPRTCIHSKHTLCYNPLILQARHSIYITQCALEERISNKKNFVCSLIHNSQFNVESLT